MAAENSALPARQELGASCHRDPRFIARRAGCAQFACRAARRSVAALRRGKLLSRDAVIRLAALVVVRLVAAFNQLLKRCRSPFIPR